MSFLQSNSSRLGGAIAAVSGIGAFAFPVVAPWHLAFLIAAILAGLGLFQGGLVRAAWTLLSFFVLVIVLAGYLPSPVAAATIAAVVLAMANLPVTAIAIVAMNLAATDSVQALFANALFRVGLEAASPAVVAIGIILLVSLRFLWVGAVCALLSLFAVWAVNQFSSNPSIAMFGAAIPACSFAGLTVWRKTPNNRDQPWPILVVVIASMLSWAWTPPRGISEVYVILPEVKDAPEAKFFDNYMEALRFAGVAGIRATRPEDVPQNGLLLLPWLTSPFRSENEDAFVATIAKLASERKWTVVAAGEHTDLGGVAKRIAAMVGRDVLRSDLSVPPNNTDDSGPLHSADLRAWYHESIFNRGASVRVNSIFDRILLAGDGWWAEPDIGEWLWVGDYIWRKNERAGRLTLAVATDVGKARWVILGDNSPLLNSQLYADPRAAIRIVEMATLWPGFARDVLFALFAGLFLWSYFRQPQPWLMVSLLSLVAAGVVSIKDGSAAWRDNYVGESGFEDRNFNEALAENPGLVAGHRFIRLKSPISGTLSLPPGNAVIFALVDGVAEVAGTKLHDCRRLGSLKTPDGPYLMDAQACKVEGPAKVLIGGPQAAAAVAVQRGQEEVYIVLDTAFLSRRAPENNKKWLVQEIEHWSKAAPQK